MLCTSSIVADVMFAHNELYGAGDAPAQTYSPHGSMDITWIYNYTLFHYLVESRIL